MSTYSAHDLAQLLHPQELEILEEIIYEFDDPDDEDDDQADRPAFSRDFAQLIIEANRQLHTHRGPKSKKKAKSKSKKKKKTDNLSPVDRERFEELAEEIDEEELGKRRLPAVPTKEEVRRLLEAPQSEDKPINRRDYLILRVLYATGCRRSELRNMRLADLNFKDQRIFIRDGKGDRDRYVLIDKKTAELLDDFTYGLALSDPIFNIQDRQINRRVKHWAMVTGLYDRYDAQDRSFTSHSLRHAFATHTHESGLDLYVLKTLLGHRFFTTTKIYIHLAVGNWLGNYEQCHPLVSDDL